MRHAPLSSHSLFSSYLFFSVLKIALLGAILFIIPIQLFAQSGGSPSYSNSLDDASQQIYSSYHYVIQTLGTGLSGLLTQVDLKTSNPAFLYYGSRPTLDLFECDTGTYGSPDYSGGGCMSIFSGVSEQGSMPTVSVQSFYVNSSVVLNPSKYYFFQTQGNNQFNSLTKVYGSAADTVDGSCFQGVLGNIIPCDTVSDLYFYLHGVTKVTATEPYGLSNVLFLPGLEASRLYQQKGVTCQVNCEDQLWESNKKTDVEDLYLNADGTSKNAGIYTRDAIKETNIPFYTGLAGQNIYKTLFDTLDSLTNPVLPEHMARWEAYAYDWRQSVDDIVNNGTSYQDGQKSLITTLENLVASSTTGKVTIIAHSNGGLLAKALMVKLQVMKDAGTNDLIDKVDVLVLVASPQIGTAIAVPVLLHGYDQRILKGLLLDEEHARELGRNMPGGYGLLPSKEYINRMSTSPVVFSDNPIPSGIMTNFISSYGNVVDSYPEYVNFLLGQEGRIDPVTTATKLPIKLSSSLLTKAEALHDSIDLWVPPAGLRIVEVAGWGLDTVASFEYYPKLTGCTGGSVGCASPYVLDQKPIFTVDGDKTVVEPSALYMGGEKYWVDINRYNRFRPGPLGSEHKNILEISQLNNLISSIIKDEAPMYDSILLDIKPINDTNRLRLSIHSPISIGSYDSLGNFTGKICSDTEDFCYIQEDIPNSSYLEFGEGKYINLPEENLQKVMLQGTGSGTFTFISEKVTPGGQTITSTFIDIPVTTQTQGEVVLNNVTQVPELRLDVNGDGTTDFTLLPVAEFDPITFLQIMKKTIDSFDIKQARKNTLSKRIDAIIKSIQKGKISKAQLKAERFQDVLKEKVAKPLPKKPKPQKLTNIDAEILIEMLETLLSNLEK